MDTPATGPDPREVRGLDVDTDPVSHVLTVYDEMELDAQLSAFALRNHPTLGTLEDEAVEIATDVSIVAFAGAVAEAAVDDKGSIDVTVVRTAFDRLAAGMDEALRPLHAPERPTGVVDWVLKATGRREHSYKELFPPLGDKYWGKQFGQQHRERSLITQADGESNADYSTRYITWTMVHFPWATFSHVG